MGIKRHTPEEIVTKLRQVEVLVRQGMARIDAIRQSVLPNRRTIVGASTMGVWAKAN